MSTQQFKPGWVDSFAAEVKEAKKDPAKDVQLAFQLRPWPRMNGRRHKVRSGSEALMKESSRRGAAKANAKIAARKQESGGLDFEFPEDAE
jgi:hypothetical protein